MTGHRALVLTIPSAAGDRESGASLRVQDVLAALRAGGHEADVVTRVPPTGSWCTAVVVSFVGAGAVAALSQRAPRVWLDAMDSWLLLDGTGLRAGHPGYGARLVRDGLRLLRMPRVDLATWISGADRRSDRGTVRAQRRLVLPGSTEPPPVRGAADRRLVLVGDWAYPPNAHGLRWLTRHVLPLLDRAVDVYGQGAAPAAGLQLYGYVADEGELYAAGDVHLCPVRFGGGVKRKVLQPLVAGLPVVSTAAGAHGLRPGGLLTVADEPVAFARAARRWLAAPVPSGHERRPPFDADDREDVVNWVGACL